MKAPTRLDPGFSVARSFRVTLDVDKKHRAFWLKIAYDFRGHRREIVLTCVEEFSEYRNRLPFAYDIVEVRPENRYALFPPGSPGALIFDTYAVVRIVAGPGVQVALTGFKPGETPSAFQPLVEIHRVQDPALVPVQGDKINPANYAGMDFLPQDYWEVFSRARRRGVGSDAMSPVAAEHPIQIEPAPIRIGQALKTVFVHRGGRFYLDLKRQPPLVAALPDGLYVHDVATDSHLVVKVPVAGGKSDQARFTYSIDYDGRNATVVHLHKAGAVGVSYSSLYREAIADGDPFPLNAFPFGEERPVDDVHEAIAEKFEVRVSDLASIHSLANQGELVTGGSDDEIKPDIELTDAERRREAYLRTFLDVGIGLIPYVGDAVDLAEFVSGYDKWGNRLTVIERAITGVGVLVPFAGGGALRSLVKAL